MDDDNEVTKDAIDWTDIGFNGAGFASPEDKATDDEAAARADRLVGKWQVFTLADAYQEREPVRYLVDGLLPYPSLSIVYGGPGSLKSMLLADLMAAIVAGGKWLEPLPGSDREPGVTFATSQAPALWIDFDNGRRRSHERMEAFARARQLPANAPFYYVSMPQPWLDASNKIMVEQLTELIDERRAKFTVIDNLKLITGKTDENAGEMAQVMGNLRWLCEEAESAVSAIHHQRKSGGANDKGIRKGESLRGHSSIEAALDLALLVERKEGEDAVAVIPTKVRGFQEHNIFGAHFTYDHKIGTKDLAMARFYSLQVSSREEQEVETVENTIKKILRDEGSLTAKDIVSYVRDYLAARPGGTAPGINKVRGIVRTMAEEGEILVDGSHSHQIYRLI